MTMAGRDVIVIGGGLPGRITAWVLCKQGGYRVTVLEAEATPGGQARAFAIPEVRHDRPPSAGEVTLRTVEHGSHAFFGYYKTVLDMIDELRSDPELAAMMPGLLPVGGWTLVDP